MKMPKKNLITILLAPVLMIVLGIFSACENEKEVIKTVEVLVHDTVTVNIISVDSIFTIPDSITEGASVRLTATTTFRDGVGPLTYHWFSTGGVFDNAEGDTVTWKAPDDPGVYVVSVHVTDGENIGIGARQVGVAMYVPTATPFYLGELACASCHQDIHDKWAETGHSHAWETLQNSGNARSFCVPCHSVGFEPAPMTGNSGYDEAPIAKFVNVQCENCHGPASEHIASGTPDPTKVEVSFDVNTCGKCHEGTHHPYLNEWEQSPHNFDPNDEHTAHGAPQNAFCQGCHEGVAAATRLSGDLSSFYGGGLVGRPDTTEFKLEPINCITCHDPHSDENPGQLRTVADVQLVTANGESPVITEGGVGKLCMQCHHARRGPDSQVINGYAFFGPHANPQADMMKGASAYHKVADPNFVWADPSHLNVQNSCKTCHLQTQEFGSGPGGAAVTGHTFMPKVEACANCHGPIADFDDIRALEDFDGDGLVEGIQSEVDGLMEILKSAIIADGLDTTGVGFEGALGDTTRSTLRQREAGYNYVFVADDKSHGIHNPDYAVQLLQQSILYISGTLPKNAVLLTADRKAVGEF